MAASGTQPGRVQISIVRIVGCCVAIVLLVSAIAWVDGMKYLARFDPPVEYLEKMDAPPQKELYVWSAWERGAGAVAAPPGFPVAAIEAHRYARRQTLFTDYMLCQAHYLMKDGSARVTYAQCPVDHATLRPYRSKMLAAAIGFAGVVVLALCVFWPKARRPE